MSVLNNFFKRNLTVKDALLLIICVSLIFILIRIFNGNSVYQNDASISCDTCGIGITDLVRRVKKELIQLEDSMTHNNENAMFKLKDLEMEISFVVRQTTTGKAGGNYEVVTVEGSAEHSNEKVQKLILHWDAENTTYDTVKKASLKPLNNHFIDSLKNLGK